LDFSTKILIIVENRKNQDNKELIQQTLEWIDKYEKVIKEQAENLIKNEY